MLFSITLRTGALRAIPGVFGCTRGSTGPVCKDAQIGWELHIAEDGRSAYQIVGEQILVFDRNPKSGSLATRIRHGATSMRKASARASKANFEAL